MLNVLKVVEAGKGGELALDKLGPTDEDREEKVVLVEAIDATRGLEAAGVELTRGATLEGDNSVVVDGGELMATVEPFDMSAGSKAMEKASAGHMQAQLQLPGGGVTGLAEGA